MGEWGEGGRSFNNFQLQSIDWMISILSSLLQSKSINDLTANGTRLQTAIRRVRLR